MGQIAQQEEKEIAMIYPSRIEHPPPVPVTQPSVQNLAHSEGIRLAGCCSLSEWIKWSLLVPSIGLVSALDCAGVTVSRVGIVSTEPLQAGLAELPASAGRMGKSRLQVIGNVASLPGK